MWGNTVVGCPCVQGHQVKDNCSKKLNFRLHSKLARPLSPYDTLLVLRYHMNHISILLEKGAMADKLSLVEVGL